MVLMSQPPPAWLLADAPQDDVVLSSRVRVMRNLMGHRFPNRCEDAELIAVMRKILTASQSIHPLLNVLKGLTAIERDHLVGCRLVAADFPWTEPGRAVLLDSNRSLSIMINEEDHLRIQALTAGWSTDSARKIATKATELLRAQLDFACRPDLGFLAASPSNVGTGVRESAMMHLIGLAHGKRLPAVIRALAARNIAVRGLFGESSRAIGAFVQVSVVGRGEADFAGAGEYLIQEERAARRQISREEVADRANQARDFAVRSRSLGLADSLRVLAWSRWAASLEIAGFAFPTRGVDASLISLELRSAAPATDQDSARLRANFLRTVLGG